MARATHTYSQTALHGWTLQLPQHSLVWRRIAARLIHQTRRYTNDLPPLTFTVTPTARGRQRRVMPAVARARTREVAGAVRRKKRHHVCYLLQTRFAAERDAFSVRGAQLLHRLPPGVRLRAVAASR
jgi:hypothetical protein